MSSKAKTLKYLKDRVSLFNVPDLLTFEISDYLKSPEHVVDKIVEYFDGQPVLAVRSSALTEDSEITTCAGEYDSVLGVSITDSDNIHAAINTVIQSYQRKDPIRDEHQFIVQEMIQNPVMSGVIFTHDLNSGAPYYVINYDDISGLTNTVTSGEGEYSNRTLYVHRNAFASLRSERFQKLLQAVQELEQLIGSQFLDVEFAIGKDLVPYLFQVRAITTQPNWNRAVAHRIDETLEGIQEFVKGRLKNQIGIFGNTTLLGQMPDWNPAEMIGRAPRALAFSLYKTLITDHAWRIAREKMGYAVPAGQPLMVSLAGQPFIDTRLSFHSFLPAGLAHNIAEKLVDSWLERLQEKPELHDKVEFDVAITTYSFDIDDKFRTLIGDKLTNSEKLQFKEALRDQAKTLLSNVGDASINSSLSKVEELARKQEKYKNLKEGRDVTSLFGMIDECIRFGTVPFSILARHGFIAKTILHSLKVRGILTHDDITVIQSGVKTIATSLVNDMRQLQLGELSRSEFMGQYGHLRPGTYDILSRRYDEMPDIGMSNSNFQPEKEKTEFSLSVQQKLEIDNLLQSEGFVELDANALLEYINSATVGREYGKFVFTRSISEILEIIACFAEDNGLSRDEISHVPIEKLLDIVTRSSEGNIEDRLRLISENESERHAISTAIRLPQVLFDEAGVHVVPFQVSHPNFITHKTVTAPCVNLVIGKTAPTLTGKIVIIENADPGFDWIFSQKIGGLITKFGGANSHMAIRCAEFGIPAAIGCGEQRYEMFVNANQILLDCATGLINPLH